jgi:DNA-binding MarR family transcriptional regulator
VGSVRDPRPFGQSIAFMLSVLGAIETRRFGELMSSFGLEPRSFGVLSLLSQAGPSTQHALAMALAIPDSTMVALIDGLEEAKLVVREPHPDDRRAWQVSLTEAGRQVVTRATARAWEHESEITGGLGEEGRAQLLELLLHVARNLSVEC